MTQFRLYSHTREGGGEGEGEIEKGVVKKNHSLRSHGKGSTGNGGRKMELLRDCSPRLLFDYLFGEWGMRQEGGR